VKSPGLNWPGTDAQASALAPRFKMTYLLYPLAFYAALIAAFFAAASFAL
jgi:hypothetical protein